MLTHHRVYRWLLVPCVACGVSWGCDKSKENKQADAAAAGPSCPGVNRHSCDTELHGYSKWYQSTLDLLKNQSSSSGGSAAAVFQTYDFSDEGSQQRWSHVLAIRPSAAAATYFERRSGTFTYSAADSVIELRLEVSSCGPKTSTFVIFDEIQKRGLIVSRAHVGDDLTLTPKPRDLTVAIPKGHDLSGGLFSAVAAGIFGALFGIANILTDPATAMAALAKNYQGIDLGDRNLAALMSHAQEVCFDSDLPQTCCRRNREAGTFQRPPPKARLVNPTSSQLNARIRYLQADARSWNSSAS